MARRGYEGVLMLLRSRGSSNAGTLGWVGRFVGVLVSSGRGAKVLARKERKKKVPTENLRCFWAWKKHLRSSTPRCQVCVELERRGLYRSYWHTTEAACAQKSALGLVTVERFCDPKTSPSNTTGQGPGSSPNYCSACVQSVGQRQESGVSWSLFLLIVLAQRSALDQLDTYEYAPLSHPLPSQPSKSNGPDCQQPTLR